MAWLDLGGTLNVYRYTSLYTGRGTQIHHITHKIFPTCVTQNILAYAKSWGEVGTSVVSAVVSIALVTLVWFAVAPIFGLTTSGNTEPVFFKQLVIVVVNAMGIFSEKKYFLQVTN